MEAKLNFQPVIDLTEEQFFEFCPQSRHAYRAQCSRRSGSYAANGRATGAQNAEITMQLGINGWHLY